MINKSELRFAKPAIRILENEHRYLSYLMEEWHAIVLLFEREKMSLEVAQKQLVKLRTQITNFMKPLKKHTDKEDRFFFPLLGNYIGLEQGPIVGIQEEHREIDGYIGHFLHHTEGNTGLLSLPEIQRAVKDAGEAFEVLTVHFMKEENVLFAMAETQITEADHKKLSEQLNTLIT